MILDEKFVRRAVVNWLSRQGYNRYLQEKETAEHGVDIKVRHYKYPRYFLIEVKGEPNAKTNKYVSSAREVQFVYALGQIISRMCYKAKYWYAVAFPESFEDKVTRRLPWQVCKKLRLKALIVHSSGKVREVTWKELKTKQTVC